MRELLQAVMNRTTETARARLRRNSFLEEESGSNLPGIGRRVNHFLIVLRKWNEPRVDLSAAYCAGFPQGGTVTTYGAVESSRAALKRMVHGWR